MTGSESATIPRVAIVVPGVALGGGVPAVAFFVRRVLHASGRYRSDMISLATERGDANSVRLLAPRSWLRGPRLTHEGATQDSFAHVGAVWSELEFQRYRPRRALTKILDEYDLVQVVAGFPAWANVVRDVRKPVVLQVATLAGVERRAALDGARGVGGAWQRAMTRITSRLDRSGLERPDVILVENEWMLEAVSRMRPGARVMLSPPGIDTELFAPSATPAGSYIVSVGRFTDPRKRVSLLIDAYSQLRRCIPNAPRLVLAGQSMPSEDAWLAAVRLGVARFIDREENVSTERLAGLYRDAQLFILSSDEEGLGIALLEAMSSGLPVVATKCGGPDMPVVNGETGFLVPVGDAQALAESMRIVLTDPVLRARMGMAGRIRAVERFSLAAAGKRFLDVYDELLTNRTATARSRTVTLRQRSGSRVHAG